MTPEEVELLQNAGQAFLQNISGLVTRSVLYGLYLAIFTFGIRALLKRNPWTKYTWTLFGFLLTLCLILTADLATMVAFDVVVIRGYLIDNPEMTLMDRFQLAGDLVAGLNNAGLWLGGGGGGGFLFICADAVVVWRACVLWAGNKTVRFSLLALLLTSFGSAVVSSTLETISFAEKNTVPTSSPTGVMLILSQFLSFATNIAATTLIGYKAYCYHHRMTGASMGVQNSRSGAALLFLTESGVVFCVLQAIAIATNLADNKILSPLDFTSVVWNQIMIFAAAAYPVLVLIIVDSHRSIADSAGGSAGDSGFSQGSNAIGSHLSFAVRPPNNSSNGDGVGEDSMIGSRVHPPTASVDHIHEGSDQVQDLEKGEGVTRGTALSTSTGQH